MLKLIHEKWILKVVSCIAVATFGSSGFAAGLAPSRIIPTEKVILYKGDQKIGEFSSEAPFPQGVLLECKGKVAAKLDSLYLVAQDKSVFSVNNTAEARELQVRKGTVYFALSTLPKTLVFTTPEETFTAEQIIVNASSNGRIKGYVSSTPEGAEVGVLEGGSMLITTDQGSQMVQPGQRVMVAAASGEAGAEPAETGASSGAAAGASGARATRGTSALMIGGIAAGVIAVGAIALAGGGGGGGGGDDHDASPSSPN